MNNHGLSQTLLIIFLPLILIVSIGGCQLALDLIMAKRQLHYCRNELLEIQKRQKQILKQILSTNKKIQTLKVKLAVLKLRLAMLFSTQQYLLIPAVQVKINSVQVKLTQLSFRQTQSLAKSRLEFLSSKSKFHRQSQFTHPTQLVVIPRNYPYPEYFPPHNFSLLQTIQLTKTLESRLIKFIFQSKKWLYNPEGLNKKISLRCAASISWENQKWISRLVPAI